jgi:hypothetical protein
MSIIRREKQSYCNDFVIFSLGQATSMSKNVTRKKIDEEFAKMGILRKY